MKIQAFLKNIMDNMCKKKKKKEKINNDTNKLSSYFYIYTSWGIFHPAHFDLAA